MDMKNIDLMQKLNDTKQTLLDDLSITYIPDRRRDINLMMDSYLSDRIPREEKENILINLSNCINGQKYEQPEKAVIKNYTFDDIEYLDKILNKFFEDLKDSPDEYEKFEDLIEKLKEEIVELDIKTENHLLDTWRMDKLDEWMSLAYDTVKNLEEMECKNKYDIGQSL